MQVLPSGTIMMVTIKIKGGFSMKQYKFETSQGFRNLIAVYTLDGISDLDVGEEAALHDIFYKHLQAWYYDDELEELEIFVDD